MPWRNGAGWTREIAVEPAEAGHAAMMPWRWRISVAEIDHDGAFSTFAGVERECTLLRGEGVVLTAADAPSISVMPPFGRQRFDGDRARSAAVVDGPVEVFNLMWQRSQVQADTWHRPLVGLMRVFVDPGDCWVVHVLAGSADLDAGNVPVPLSTGDTAILRADGARAGYRVQGGGDLLLARLAPQPG